MSRHPLRNQVITELNDSKVWLKSFKIWSRTLSSKQRGGFQRTQPYIYSGSEYTLRDKTGDMAIPPFWRAHPEPVRYLTCGCVVTATSLHCRIISFYTLRRFKVHSIVKQLSPLLHYSISKWLTFLFCHQQKTKDWSDFLGKWRHHIYSCRKDSWRS